MRRTVVALAALHLHFVAFGASAQSAPRLFIERGSEVVSISVLDSRRGPLVRLEETLTPLGAAVLRQGTGRYRFVLGSTQIDLQVGLAAALVGRETEQLTVAPAEFEGSLLVPLALITDLVPRATQSFEFDRSTETLRRRGAQAAPPAAVRSPAVAPPRDSGNRDVATARPTPTRTPPPPVASPRRREAPVVIVDAGHGGRDRGMRGPIGSAAKVAEADITLGIAKQLATELKGRGITVVMTRSTDTLIALRDRGRIANRAEGTLFLSIHVNAANPRWRQPGSARGFETYFLSAARTEDERRVEEVENEAVKYEEEESFDSNDPMSFILNDMKQNEHLRESQDLARTIQQGLASVHPGPNRGVKQAGFAVLVHTFMPSVLVEVGYGSNPTEARYLASAAGQKAIATAIAAAAQQYLEDLERRNATAQSGGTAR